MSGTGINWASWLLWGWISTIVLTTLMTITQGARLTRISIPYILGSMLTPSRDTAKLVGFGIHMLNGWAFSLIYVLAFHSARTYGIWPGIVAGLTHGAFVATFGMWLLPGLHPRMASEQQGPTVMRQLEPPGFLGLNYGLATPVSILASHLIYGMILGAFYRPLPGL
jgi:hypothetical protein